MVLPAACFGACSPGTGGLKRPQANVQPDPVAAGSRFYETTRKSISDQPGVYDMTTRIVAPARIALPTPLPDMHRVQSRNSARPLG